MDYTPLNVAPYQNGFWVSWGADGTGISSACVSFVFNSSGHSSSSSLQYDVNVTTEADLNGYLQLEGNSTRVNLTIYVLNEGKPALAQNFTFYVENDTDSWVKVDSPNIIDFGNGTYSVSFTTGTYQSNNPLLVSMLCQDQRGIFVRANATCTT